MRALLAASVASAWLGCIGTPEGTTTVPVLDYETYAQDVQPIFVERCGNPTCHGRPERPFSVYGPERYRVDPARTFLDEPLSEHELLANYESACAFSLRATDPTTCLLLSKPLAVHAGGAGHLGGDVWVDRDELEYRIVEDWLETARREAP